jgi:hypothetical protein
MAGRCAPPACPASLHISNPSAAAAACNVATALARAVMAFKLWPAHAQGGGCSCAGHGAQERPGHEALLRASWWCHHVWDDSLLLPQTERRAAREATSWAGNAGAG